MVERGVFRFDRLTVAPRLPADRLERLSGVRRVTLPTAAVYLLDVRWAERPWELQATARQGVVEDFVLRRREAAGLEETFFEQNRLLADRLGTDFESRLGQRAYRLPWGSIRSLLDAKTGECSIWVNYL